MPFTSRDYALMHYYYGYARGNASEAARLYREEVQNGGGSQPETWPDHRMILRVHNSYMEGRLPGVRSGRIRELRDPDTVESVLEEVAADSSISVRTLERRIGVSKSQAHRILQQEGFHPYHIQRVQQRKSKGKEQREEKSGLLSGNAAASS
ncbi:unnamed protein product [Leptosia nina]|uniref:Uncharacterized protein n=1 Tax=Leptosia nina TaxID=320188 RepID=A0AAV1IWC9_9NEOP